MRRASPLHRNTPLDFIQEILDVWTALAVHGDATAASDVADDIVAGNRRAAFRAIHHQIVVATAHHDRAFVHAQHALDGGNDLRLFVFARLSDWLAGSLGEHLARGPFSVAEVGVEIFYAPAAVVGRNALPVLIGNFLQRDIGLTRFLLQQPAAHIRRLCALVQIDPLPYFAAGARSVNEGQPVARRLVSFLSENFDHIAIGQRVPQRHQRAIHFRAAALISDFRVNRIREIDGRGAARKNDHTALRRKSVNLFGIEVHAQRGEKFARLLHFLHPLDQLPHPHDALVICLRKPCASIFVFPVRRDALLGNAMHFLRADLHFEGLACVDNRGVQRLVQVGPRHRDVILETAGNRRPDLVDHA